MKYEKNYITDAICRIDFPEIPHIKKEEPLEFYDKVKPIFKRFEKSVTADIDIKDKGVSILKQGYKWVFYSKEKDKKLTLSSKTMALEFFQYNTFEEYKKIWETAYSALLISYEVEFCDRVGLRYVNNIDIEKGNPLTWDGLINKNLIKHLKSFPEMNSDIIRSMQKLVFNKEGIKINFNYGIWNENFPNTLSKKQFILDYDCYIDYMLDASEINTKISEFIEIIYDLFEKSIDNKLREIMGGKK